MDDRRHTTDKETKPGQKVVSGPSSVVSKRQLSYKEKREFENLETEIAVLTREKETITKRLNSGEASFDELQQLSNRIGEVSNLLDEKELRWLELSELIQQ